MNKGFIINKHSDKVGEFSNATIKQNGTWNLENVKIDKGHYNLSSNTTKEQYLFLLVEEIEKDSFEVIDSMGVGFIFCSGHASSWSAINDVIIHDASFVEGRSNYEN